MLGMDGYKYRGQRYTLKQFESDLIVFNKRLGLLNSDFRLFFWGVGTSKGKISAYSYTHESFTLVVESANAKEAYLRCLEFVFSQIS